MVTIKLQQTLMRPGRDNLPPHGAGEDVFPRIIPEKTMGGGSDVGELMYLTVREREFGD